LVGARLEAAGTVFALAEVVVAQGDAVAAAAYFGDAYRCSSALGLTLWSALLAQVTGERALSI
jgi:hypothetical protein